VTDAKDRRLAELEAQLDASFLEAALDSEERLARRVAQLEAERDEADSQRHGRLLAVIEADRVERDRLRVALTQIAWKSGIESLIRAGDVLATRLDETPVVSDSVLIGHMRAIREWLALAHPNGEGHKP
jgi:hypothetical protein